MNQRRSSARIFQIFLLSSALLCAMAHANDDRSALLESLLPLIRGLQQSNPFELEFDNGFELEDGSFRVWRHKYIQSGEMWREEIRDEKGELRLVTSFDGERYFWYDPVGINLHIAKDPEGPGASEIFHRSILSAFRNNPLTCWAFPFFWNWDSRSEFILKQIRRPTTWADSLGNYSVEAFEAADQQLKWRFESPFIQVETLFIELEGGVRRVEETRLRYKNRATSEFTDMQSLVRYNDWLKVKSEGLSLYFPKEYVVETRYHDGRKVVGGDEWSKLVEGSVKALPEGLGQAAFRVPLSAVPDPRIWD